MKIPKISKWILVSFSSKKRDYSYLGDLEEYFYELAEDKGEFYAKLWYRFHAVKSVPFLIFNQILWNCIFLKTYLKITLRNFKRQKIYTIINISGLSLGMSICIIITLWIKNEFSFDKFHENGDRICRVLTQAKNAPRPWATTEGPLAAALKADYPEVINATRYKDGANLLITMGDRKIIERRYGFVDPDFFQIFTFEFLKGDPGTVFKDPFSIILTEKTAKKCFGNEDPIGKTLNLDNNTDVTVTGILKNIPKTSHLKFTCLLSFRLRELWGDPVNKWGNSNFYTYLLLAENISFSEFNNKINTYMVERNPNTSITLFIQPLDEIRLNSHFQGDVANHGSKTGVYAFSLIGGFILLIACINFTNLATAKSNIRAKEIGMRKVTGAKKTDIVKQFLGESIFLTFFSLIFSVIIAFLILPKFNEIFQSDLSLNFFTSPSLFLILIIIALVTGILSGLYPSIFVSSFQPANILRGTLFKRSNRFKSNSRRVLVVFQFSISIFLIISTIILSGLSSYIKNKSLGFDKNNILFLPITGELRKSYTSVKNELLKNPDILSVSASSNLPTYGRDMMDYIRWEGMDPNHKLIAEGVIADYDYFKTFKMEIIDGREFSMEISTDASEGFILNEEAVREMELESPVGKQITFFKKGTIIGIVKDYHFKPLDKRIEPLVIFIKPDNLKYLFVRLQPGIQDYSNVVKQFKEIWSKHVPAYPFNYGVLSHIYKQLYKPVDNIETLFKFLSFTAILIACLGLFGLASYSAERKTKEIGIRKVLGASVSNIIKILVREFVILVFIASFIAWPITYFIIQQIYKNLPYHPPVTIFPFLISILTALIIAVLTVSSQAYKTASKKPVTSLRYE